MKRYVAITLPVLACLALMAGPAAAQYTEVTTGCGTFNSISTTGTRLNAVSNCDDCTQSITRPAFPWYGGTPITQVAVSSNGQINMDNSNINNCCSADPVVVGGAVLYPRIAFAQEDLQPSGRGDVYAQDMGAAGFIIEFNNVCFFSCDGDINAQIVLHPDGNIDLRYGNMRSDSGDSIAVGVEDDTQAPPQATPAGPPAGATGIVAPANVALLTNTCRRYELATTPTPGGGCSPTQCANLDCSVCSRATQTSVDALQGSVDQVQSDLSLVDTKVDALEAKGDQMQAELTDVKAEVTAIAGSFGDIPCDVLELLLPVLPGAPELPTTHPCFGTNLGGSRGR